MLKIFKRQWIHFGNVRNIHLPILGAFLIMVCYTGRCPVLTVSALSGCVNGRSGDAGCCVGGCSEVVMVFVAWC